MRLCAGGVRIRPHCGSHRELPLLGANSDHLVALVSAPAPHRDLEKAVSVLFLLHVELQCLVALPARGINLKDHFNCRHVVSKVPNAVLSLTLQSKQDSMT